jgi:poly(hydroxyalkanoate) granule-associated protein
MSEYTQNIQEQVENSYNFVTGTVHKTFLFGLGAVALAQDEIIDLWKNGDEIANKLVERGEEVSRKRREQISELVEKPQAQVKDVTKKAEESFEKYSDQVLTRINMPSVEDFEGLTKKFGTLNRKIDKALREQKESVAQVEVKMDKMNDKLDQALEQQKAVA